ncbi:MAG: hypothetical protein NWQ13_07215 [Glaciimonas sp.]|nr:hypothetical protein [Glaciimonas sp.]
MKIKIKLPASTKPRNPLVAPSKFRKAGAHAPPNPRRQSRRDAKHHLYLQLAGRKKEDDV